MLAQPDKVNSVHLEGGLSWMGQDCKLTLDEVNSVQYKCRLSRMDKLSCAHLKLNRIDKLKFSLGDKLCQTRPDECLNQLN